MPIYAYRCTTCGHAKDVLQKMSDPLLSVCPACGASTFTKQLTAAGFQLKGSGWYATDFKGGTSAPAAGGGDAKPDGKSDGKPESKPEAKPDAKTDAKTDSKPAAKPDAKALAGPSAPAAASCGGG